MKRRKEKGMKITREGKGRRENEKSRKGEDLTTKLILLVIMIINSIVMMTRAPVFAVPGARGSSDHVPAWGGPGLECSESVFVLRHIPRKYLDVLGFVFQ